MSLNYDLECPRCGHEFEGEEWINDSCPQCKNQYRFDEIPSFDYSECWIVVYWEFNK